MYIEATFFLSVFLNSAIYFVAVIPKPAAPNMTNILIVERTKPNSPYCSLPKILATTIPAINTKNFPKTVPQKVQKAPRAIRLPISDKSILSYSLRRKEGKQSITFRLFIKFLLFLKKTSSYKTNVKKILGEVPQENQANIFSSTT